MKMERDKYLYLATPYADNHSITRYTLDNLIIIYLSCRNGVTMQSVNAIRERLDEDTLNYIFRNRGFADPKGKYDETHTYDIVYSFGHKNRKYEFNDRQKRFLLLAMNKYVVPFCRNLYLDFTSKYKELYNED